MTYAESKAEVVRILGLLAERAPEGGNDEQTADVAELLQDIANDFYTVVVVGEFNRGKSTLLNALLGGDILPVGVTPTTATINVLMYSDAPRIRVYGNNGENEDKQLTPAALQEFVAESDFQPESVRYVEIGFPSPVLEKGMVYVDTPGVDDLSQQRADITYRFLPRADAVICVLDGTTPVTRSEQEFLETAVLAHRIGRLIFVVNFADKLEDDDREGLEELVQSRLANALGGERPPVFLISAKAGLADRAGNNDGSGLKALRDCLNELQAFGPQSTEKALRFVSRAEGVVRRILGAQQRQISIATSAQIDLEKQLVALDASLQSRAARKQKIELWVNERGNEMILMVRSSLATFAEELRQEIEDIVTGYNGSEFKHLVERQIPILVKRRCKNWIDSHSSPISSLFEQFAANLTEGLENEFNTRIPSLAHSNASRHSFGVSIQITAEDVKGARGKVGIVAAGTAALAMALGAPIVVPFVTLAGYPFLSEKLHEHQLSQAKAKLRPELYSALEMALATFNAKVVEAITDELHSIQRAAEERYDILLQQASQQVKTEIVRRQDTRLLADRSVETIQVRADTLEHLYSDLQRLESSLKAIEGVMA